MRRVYRSLFRYKQKGFASLVQHEHLWKQDQGCSVPTAQANWTKKDALKISRLLSCIVELGLQQTLNTPNDSFVLQAPRSLRGPVLPRLRDQLSFSLAETENLDTRFLLSRALEAEGSEPF